jgi:hypothetical protein
VTIDRPWLAEGLERGDREALLYAAVERAGWRVRRWSFRLSQTWAPLRTIWLSATLPTERVVPTLAHEWEHARRAEAVGRWSHAARYMLAPALLAASMAAGLAAVVAHAVDGSPVAGVSLVLMLLGLLLWRWSERFRRAEEVEGFAAGGAATMAQSGADMARPFSHITAYTLQSYAWPYLVSGSFVDVRRAVAGRAVQMLVAERPTDDE